MDVKGRAHEPQERTAIAALPRRTEETRQSRTRQNRTESNPADSRTDNRTANRAPRLPLTEYRLRVMRKTRIRDAQARELMLYRTDGQPVLLPVNPGKPQKP